MEQHIKEPCSPTVTCSSLFTEDRPSLLHPFARHLCFPLFSFVSSFSSPYFYPPLRAHPVMFPVCFSPFFLYLLSKIFTMITTAAANNTYQLSFLISAFMQIIAIIFVFFLCILLLLHILVSIFFYTCHVTQLFTQNVSTVFK